MFNKGCKPPCPAPNCRFKTTSLRGESAEFAHGLHRSCAPGEHVSEYTGGYSAAPRSHSVSARPIDYFRYTDCSPCRRSLNSPPGGRDSFGPPVEDSARIQQIVIDPRATTSRGCSNLSQEAGRRSADLGAGVVWGSAPRPALHHSWPCGAMKISALLTPISELSHAIPTPHRAQMP